MLINSKTDSKKTLIDFLNNYEKNNDIYKEVEEVYLKYKKNSFNQDCSFFILKDIFIRDFKHFILFEKEGFFVESLKLRFLTTIINYHFTHKNYKDINIISKYINEKQLNSTGKYLCSKVIHLRRLQNNELYMVFLFSGNLDFIILFDQYHKLMMKNIINKEEIIKESYKKAMVKNSIKSF
jgi:hypothetical protein